MKIAAARSLPVAVHAEDDLMTYALAEERRDQGKIGWRDYLESRPVEAELRAIRVALELAGEIGCDLHIVHVSCPEGIDLIRAARDLGVQVTAETCPHYLLLTDESVGQIGASAKCAPPLGDATRREEMWKRMRAGGIDTLGSDHSPSPPEMKLSENFFSVWGGISGCQHAFPLALAEWRARSELDGFSRFSAVSATNVAERFGIGRVKGRIAEGFDADITLVDLQGSVTSTAEQLFYRHTISPYIGFELRALVKSTWVPEAMILVILVLTIVGLIVPAPDRKGMITAMPIGIVNLPASLAPTFLKLDLSYFWKNFLGALPVVLAILFVDLFDAACLQHQRRDRLRLAYVCRAESRDRKGKGSWSGDVHFGSTVYPALFVREVTEGGGEGSKLNGGNKL